MKVIIDGVPVEVTELRYYVGKSPFAGSPCIIDTRDQEWKMEDIVDRVEGLNKGLNTWERVELLSYTERWQDAASTHVTIEMRVYR